LVINPGLSQKFGGSSHLNMVTIANSCGPGCDIAQLQQGASQ
jgi:hypothetical protein